MRRLAPLAIVLVLAACGSSSHRAATTTATTTPTTTTAAVPAPGPGRVLYDGGAWGVVLNGHRATAVHLVGRTWRPDRTRAVRILILGPQPGRRAAATPQVAAELIANAPLVESGLWVDGQELVVKGGGLNPKRGTIYGAPAAPLGPGTHVAVAYARTASHATAVAWTFKV